MAVVHARIKDIKGNKYIYIYRSMRVGGRPVSKFVAYLGRVGTDAIRRLPKKYKTAKLVEQIKKLERDIITDEIGEKNG